MFHLLLGFKIFVFKSFDPKKSVFLFQHFGTLYKAHLFLDLNSYFKIFSRVKLSGSTYRSFDVK